VKRYKVRFTPEAEDDLLRLYDFQLERDVSAAERALEAIKAAVDVLRFSPFSCRKAAKTSRSCVSSLFLSSLPSQPQPCHRGTNA
jgi:plasmid stabilization system protein ParE